MKRQFKKYYFRLSRCRKQDKRISLEILEDNIDQKINSFWVSKNGKIIAKKIMH